MNNSPFPLLLWLFLCFLFSISDFSFFVFCLFGLGVLKMGRETILVLLVLRLSVWEQKTDLSLPGSSGVPSFCAFKSILEKMLNSFCSWLFLTSSGFLFLALLSFSVFISVFIFLGLNSELKDTFGHRQVTHLVTGNYKCLNPLKTRWSLIKQATHSLSSSRSLFRDFSCLGEW